MYSQTAHFLLLDADILSSAHQTRKAQNDTDSKMSYPLTPAEISDILSGESLK